MKTKKGFKLRPLGDEWILVGESVEQINFNKIITMNETAAFLWTKTQEHKGVELTPEVMADWLCEEYEVSREQALMDAKLTLENWAEIGIAE